jgi:hypothetical protein
MNAGRVRTTGWVAMLILFTAPLVHANTTIFTDPFQGSSGDQLTRGFYLSSYPGTNLGTVTLAYSVNTPGVYTTSLTARLGTYNGTIIGSTQTVTTTLGASETQVTYNFGGAPVATGSVVTFTQVVVSGPDVVFFDVGTAGPAGITETEGTTPPLDVFRRASTGVIVTQAPFPLTPAPSSLVLLLTALTCVGLYRLTKKRVRA